MSAPIFIILLSVLTLNPLQAASSSLLAPFGIGFFGTGYLLSSMFIIRYQRSFNSRLVADIKMLQDMLANESSNLNALRTQNMILQTILLCGVCGAGAYVIGKLTRRPSSTEGQTVPAQQATTEQQIVANQERDYTQMQIVPYVPKRTGSRLLPTNRTIEEVD